jgi:hypothetical protein
MDERKRENQDLEKKLDAMGNDLKTRNEFLHSKRKQAEL